MSDERDENGLNEADRRLDQEIDAALEKAGVPEGADLVITSWETDYPPNCGVIAEKGAPLQFHNTPTFGDVFHDLCQKAVGFPRLGEPPHTAEYLNDDPATETVVIKDKYGHIRCTMPKATFEVLRAQGAAYEHAVIASGRPEIKMVEPNRPITSVSVDEPPKERTE